MMDVLGVTPLCTICWETNYSSSHLISPGNGITLRKIYKFLDGNKLNFICPCMPEIGKFRITEPRKNIVMNWCSLSIETVNAPLVYKKLVSQKNTSPAVMPLFVCLIECSGQYGILYVKRSTCFNKISHYITQSQLKRLC